MPDSERRAQLVVEIPVSDIEHSIEFYVRLGFRLARRDGDFAVVTWDGHHLFLNEHKDLSPLPTRTHANVRVIVDNVDNAWDRVGRIGGIRVAKPIGDREYGLRDFTILDPDGFGIRFAAALDE